MKRSLVLCMLALSALGGCAATSEPIAVDSAAGSPAAATQSPVVAESQNGTKATFQAIMLPYVSNPSLLGYMGAATASDYKSMRKFAPDLGVSFKKTADALTAVHWPEDVQSDMDAFVFGMRRDGNQFEAVAATTTDDETKKYVDTHQGSDNSAGDKVSADFGIVNQ